MNFIHDLLISRKEPITNPDIRENYGKVAGIIGIISNIVLFVIKIIAGLLSKSIAVTADAVNNLSDAGSSLITLIGFKMAGKPADAEHPYGHARIEYIAGLIVSFMVAIIGFQLLTSSISKIFNPEESVYTFLTFTILIISVLAKVLQCMMYRKIGKAIDSVTLIATSTDSLSDVITTIVVLIGTIIGNVTNWHVDGYFGVAVALFIIYSGIRLIIDTSNPLLGTPPKKEFVQQINDKIRSYEGVIGIHDLVIHSYGPERCFASVHVEVPAERDILVSHDIIDNIEHDFLRDLKIHLVIHLDPVVTNDVRITHIFADIKEAIYEIFPTLNIHDFRVVFGTTHTNLIFDVTIPINSKMSDKSVCHIIRERIRSIDLTYNAVITVDRDYNL